MCNVWLNFDETMIGVLYPRLEHIWYFLEKSVWERSSWCAVPYYRVPKGHAEIDSFSRTWNATKGIPIIMSWDWDNFHLQSSIQMIRTFFFTSHTSLHHLLATQGTKGQEVGPKVTLLLGFGCNVEVVLGSWLGTSQAPSTYGKFPINEILPLIPPQLVARVVRYKPITSPN